jgi:hypothetical protein
MKKLMKYKVVQNDQLTAYRAIKCCKIFFSSSLFVAEHKNSGDCQFRAHEWKQQKLSEEASCCSEPHVPTRMMLSDRSCGLTVLFSRSILTRASSSCKTISILSVPIPVDTTEISYCQACRYE